MSPKGRGGGKTPERLVKLLNEAVLKKSIRSISRDTGLGLAPISRYLKGTSEPSQSTLEKLADYFGVTVEFLRGEGDFNHEEMSEILSVRKGVPVGTTVKIIEAVVEALAKRGALLPKEGNPERGAYIILLREHVERECSAYMKYVWEDCEIDKILGVDEEEHRAQQIRYIAIATKMASDEELNLLVKLAEDIVDKHSQTGS